MNLVTKKCKPCEDKNAKPLDDVKREDLLKEVSGWKLSSDKKSITRSFVFKDFTEAVDFFDQVAKIAEGEGHHPDIEVLYNKVNLSLSTHSIGGLTENDFIVAAKIDALTNIS